MNAKHDPDKPTVARRDHDGLIIIVCKNADTGKTESIRFPEKYSWDLAKDIVGLGDNS